VSPFGGIGGSGLYEVRNVGIGGGNDGGTRLGAAAAELVESLVEDEVFVELESRLELEFRC
jgi:hypothetical protein